MRHVAIVLALAVGSMAQARLPAPQVSAYFTRDGLPGFEVDLLNTADSGLSPHCRMRLDGVAESENFRWVGIAPNPVKPGDTWRELVTLGASVARYNVPEPGGFTLHREIAVMPAAGRHSIAFSCGGEWSTDSAFIWSGGKASITPANIALEPTARRHLAKDLMNERAAAQRGR